MASGLLGAGGSQRGRRRRRLRRERGGEELGGGGAREDAGYACKRPGVMGRALSAREQQMAEAAGADAEWLGGFKTQCDPCQD